jgi:hypothetical protein
MEATMIDQEMAQMWAAHHVALGKWVRDAAHQVGDAFRVLARVQYDRPWDHDETPRARH